MADIQLHPDFRQLSAIRPPINRVSVAVIQPLMRLLYAREKSDAQVSVEKFTIDTPAGYRMPSLMYKPRTLQNDGCVLYCHGGGFVFPAAPYQYALARTYAARVGCRVLFIDYRLAPQHPFPAAPEDCFAAYRWLLAHAAERKINPRQLVVCGDSAGGTLAMVVTLMAIEHELPVPCAQLLTYPSVGDCGETESMRLYTDTPMCSSKDAAKYGQMYTPDPNAGKLAYRSPVQADSFAGVPATYVETAEFDCLRDGALIYADKLRAAGVPVELHQTKGTPHGYDMALNSGIVQALVEKRIDFLRQMLSE